MAYYLVPRIGTGEFKNAFRPKYFADELPGASWAACQVEEGFIVEIDLTPKQENDFLKNNDFKILTDENEIAAKIRTKHNIQATEEIKFGKLRK